MVPIRPATLEYPFVLALLHGLLAWVVGVAAAVASAVRAARIEPAEVMRSADIVADVRTPSWMSWLGTAGAAIGVYLALVLATGVDSSVPMWQSLNAGAGLIAAILVTPVAVLATLRMLLWTRPGRALLDRNAILRLGSSHLLHAPGRNAWRAILLSLGLLTFVVVDNIHESLVLSVEGWLDRTVFSDILVASPGRLFMMEVQPLHESLTRRIDTVPGVRMADGRGAMGIRYASIRYEGRDVTVKAFDRPHAFLGRLPFDFRAGYRLESAGDIFSAATPSALVSENFVKHFGKVPGDELILDSPAGPVRVRLLGVVTDFASPVGVVYLSRELYRDRWSDPLVSVFSVMVEPGFEPARVAEAIETALGSEAVRTTNQRQLRRQTSEIIGESFAYATAIEAAALAAAILAIANSMVASVIASRRQISLLRALGMSGNQGSRMVVLEGLALGVPASLAAIGLGSLLSYLCLVELASAIMGWTLEFHVSTATIALAALVGTASGVAASAMAAWKVRKAPIIQGLLAY